MGSDSDLPKVQPASEELERLAVPHEMLVASAHRTPERAAKLAREARDRGIKVIIAAAGARPISPGCWPRIPPCR